MPVLGAGVARAVVIVVAQVPRLARKDRPVAAGTGRSSRSHARAPRGDVLPDDDGRNRAGSYSSDAQPSEVSKVEDRVVHRLPPETEAGVASLRSDATSPSPARLPTTLGIKSSGIRPDWSGQESTLALQEKAQTCAGFGGCAATEDDCPARSPWDTHCGVIGAGLAVAGFAVLCLVCCGGADTTPRATGTM